MDRSNYPTKVEVRRADLEGTERTKAFHILKRFLDTGQPGIISGLTVQQSSVGLDRFDLLLGYGYAPNGELTELTATLEGQSVGALPGVPALAGLMYREVAQRAGAAETDGIARDRETVRSSEIRVFTADQWSALPTTFDDDLSADAQDRFLVCGIVTKPTVDGDPLEIVLPPSWDLIKTIGRTTITGVFITAIDPDTADTDPFPQTGTEDQAVLIYQPSSTSLAYKAPHDTVDLGWLPPFNIVGMGTAVDVSAGGAFPLTSANGVNTLDVIVDAALLPSTTTSFVVDPLNVSTLYYPAAARGSGRDDIHRHQLGTLVPTAANPHGLRWSDLQTLLEEVFGTLSIGTQYTDLVSGEVPRLWFPANPAIDDVANYRTAQIAGFEGANTTRFNNLPMQTRVYRGSAEDLLITVNCRIRNSGVSGLFERLAANGDDPDTVAAMIEIGPLYGIRVYTQPAASPDTWTYATWGTVNLSLEFAGNRTLISNELLVGGQTTLGYNRLTGDADTQIPRLVRNFQDDGTVIRTLLEGSEGATAPGVNRLRIYRSTVSGTLADALDFVYNAVWDETNDRWSSDHIGYVSWKISFGRGGLEVAYRLAGFGTWFDNAWTETITLDAYGVQIGSAQNYLWSTPRTFTKSIPAICGCSNLLNSAVFIQVGTADPTGLRAFLEKLVGAGARVIWPLELPQGAEVIEARVNTNALAVTSYVRGAVCRQHLTSGANAETFKNGAPAYDAISAPNSKNVLTCDAGAGIRTIDNSTYSYFVWVSSDAPDSYEITGIEVDYTLTQVELP